MQKKAINMVFRTYVIFGYLVAASSIPFWFITNLLLSSLTIFVFGLVFAIGTKLDWKDFNNKYKDNEM